MDLAQPNAPRAGEQGFDRSEPSRRRCVLRWPVASQPLDRCRPAHVCPELSPSHWYRRCGGHPLAVLPSGKMGAGRPCVVSPRQASAVGISASPELKCLVCGPVVKGTRCTRVLADSLRSPLTAGPPTKYGLAIGGDRGVVGSPAPGAIRVRESGWPVGVAERVVHRPGGALAASYCSRQRCKALRVASKLCG